jgi:replicative DNA helicase
VDYIGLVRSINSKSRYEAVSNAAEEMKVIAKRTETIIIMASQIGRPDKKSEGKPVGLHDARDSGALENSSGLVIACERPSRERLLLRVLKDTKGRNGDTIELDFNAAQMSITPRDPSRMVDDNY